MSCFVGTVLFFLGKNATLNYEVENKADVRLAVALSRKTKGNLYDSVAEQLGPGQIVGELLNTLAMLVDDRYLVYVAPYCSRYG